MPLSVAQHRTVHHAQAYLPNRVEAHFADQGEPKGPRPGGLEAGTRHYGEGKSAFTLSHPTAAFRFRRYAAASTFWPNPAGPLATCGAHTPAGAPLKTSAQKSARARVIEMDRIHACTLSNTAWVPVLKVSVRSPRPVNTLPWAVVVGQLQRRSIRPGFPLHRAARGPLPGKAGEDLTDINPSRLLSGWWRGVPEPARAQPQPLS